MYFVGRGQRAYFAFPSPERTSLGKRLALNDAKHARHRFLCAYDSFDLPVHRDIRHVARDSQHDDRGRVIRDDVRLNFSRVYRQDRRVYLLALEFFGQVLKDSV